MNTSQSTQKGKRDELNPFKYFTQVTGAQIFAKHQFQLSLYKKTRHQSRRCRHQSRQLRCHQKDQETMIPMSRWIPNQGIYLGQ